MKGLLYKELRMAKKEFITLILCGCGIWGICLFSDMAGDELSKFMTKCVMYLGTFLMGMMVINKIFFGEEESKKWNFFVIATPKRGQGIVKSKYIAVAILFLFLFAELLLIEFLTGIGKDEPVVFYYYVIALLGCIFLFLMAFRMPFMVLFGARVGQKVEAIIFSIFMAWALWYGLYGDISIFMENDFVKVLGNLQDMLANIGVANLLKLLCISLAVYTLSGIITGVFFTKCVEKRESY